MNEIKKTTTCKINGWTISTVYIGVQEPFILRRLAYNDSFVVIFDRETNTEFDKIFYRCSVKRLGSSQVLTSVIGDTPLKALRAARQELTLIKIVLADIREV